jgi:hypothetical protein
VCTVWLGEDFLSFGTKRECIIIIGSSRDLRPSAFRESFLRAREEEKHFQHGIGVVKSERKMAAF